jgi:glycosyltransferase involved in cell wall biosynthesis
MAAKVPIVSTLVGGLREVLRNGENAIIVEPKNIYDLAEKIKFVLNNQEICNELAENAYSEVKEKYDLPIIKKQFLNILANNLKFDYSSLQIQIKSH